MMGASIIDRGARVSAWISQKGRWVYGRQWAMVVVIALVGLGIRHAWLSPQPLSAGDWHWPDNPVLANYSPWPSVWDSSLGLGGENRFSAAFRFPIYAITGLFAVLGAGWTVTEKLFYFIPFAVLLPVGGWLLAREIMGRTKWTLLTPVILVGATYFMLESNGEVPLALAEVISFFVLIAFLKTVKQLSFRWALITGLMLAVVALYDVRPAYLCVLLMLLYFVIVSVAERNGRVFLRRFALGAAAGVAFVGLQAFWLVPLLTYHGGVGLPIPQAPNFNVLTLGHGLTGVDAFWTGGTPAQLVQAPLNPAYMILPLLALIPLLARRVRPEVLWLTLAALLFAFFAKTDNAPLGGIYDWMYIHIPGWKLFREGSKFLYIVTLAYALLIPMALASVFQWCAAHATEVRARLLRAGAAAALVGVVVLSAWSVVILQTGTLGSTTQSTPEPAAFTAFSSILANDPRPGPVLWFGQPLVGNNIHNHHFLIASPTHPAVNLTGKFAGSRTNQRDPFQLYCPDNVIAYCYLDPNLFPYLVRMAGAGYVVVPGGQGEGSLPAGITRGWLLQQMSEMGFGSPMVLGSGSTSIWVWRINPTQPAVTSAPAIAVVDSGTWATTEALPALQALNIPAAYLESFDNNQYPVAPRNLPDSVAIMPNVNNACLANATGTAALMAQTAAPSIQVTVKGIPLTLSLLTAQGLPRKAGWNVYGPFQVASGANTITSAAETTPAASAVALGPCLSWSSLTATALGDHTTSVSAIKLTASDEQITASTNSVNGTWVELRRYYDPGWRLDTHKPMSLGDGLFNLYHLDSAQSSAATLSFTYSTLPYERIGEGIALIALVATVWLIIRVPRRFRFAASATPMPVRAATFPPSLIARWIAGIGIAMLVVTAVALTLEWFGVPSAIPEVAVAPDPYSVDIGYGGVAIGLLLLSLGVRFTAGIFRAPGEQRDEPPAAEPAPSVPPPARRPAGVGAGAAALMIASILASCGQSAGDFQNLIAEAQQAGSVAPSILGSSLDDARLQRAARQPDLCIADYTQALQEFPQYEAAYIGRGDCYLNGGQNGAAAVHDYSEAMQLSPLQADPYLRRAVAYRVIGNLAAAAADYRHAALIPSATAGQQLSAIDGLVAISDYTDAQTVYARALVLDPGTSLLYVAGGDLAIAVGNQPLADQDFATATAFASTKAQQTQVLSHECHAEVLRHQYPKALLDCATAAHNSSSGSGAYDDLAEANLALGNLQNALTGINQAISNFIGSANAYTQTQGVDGFGLSNLLAAKGWIQIQLGQTHSAVDTFNSALNALPGPAPDTRARIKAYIETAKKDE